MPNLTPKIKNKVKIGLKLSKFGLESCLRSQDTLMGGCEPPHATEYGVKRWEEENGTGLMYHLTENALKWYQIGKKIATKEIKM